MLNLLEPELPMPMPCLRRHLCRFASFDDAYEHARCWRLKRGVWVVMEVEELMASPVNLQRALWAYEPQPRRHEWIIWSGAHQLAHTCPVYK